MSDAKLSKFQKFEMVRMLRSAIREHPKNPRVLGEGAKKKLRSKMKDVGLLQPIIVNKTTGYLLGGHQRLGTMDGLEKYKVEGNVPVNDYLLDVAVCALDEKAEAEMLVFLNNPSGQGSWDLEALAGLQLDGAATFEGMGFDKVDVEVMFDGDARFEGLFGDDAEARERKEALKQMKGDGAEAAREKGKSGLDQFRDKGGRDNSSDFYVVVVCKDQAEKEALLKHLRLPKGEQYIAPHEIMVLVRP